MRQETEELLYELLIELLKYLRVKNVERQRKQLNDDLDEIDRTRWGYPPLRSGRSRRRTA